VGHFNSSSNAVKLLLSKQLPGTAPAAGLLPGGKEEFETGGDSREAAIRGPLARRLAHRPRRLSAS